ncbi:Hypothetical predicted protein [Paramuricea clavata]|uniref:Uncharacterized protein n=1 Tax=Paramuricea clavata TaxID=317549 RepID=A0A7D9I622_PARCT|nr:Hypothetical predicted protein [Paramuricea clavata]
MDLPLFLAICRECRGKHDEKMSQEGEWVRLKADTKSVNDITDKLKMTSLSPCLTGTISPSTSLASPDATDMWTPSNATLINYSSSSCENQSTSTTDVYNESMSHLASLMSFKEISPLSFRLTSSWDETTQSEKEACIEKASEACQVICEVIAPNAGEELFEAMNFTSSIHVSEELAALMTAYKNATTQKLKLEIIILRKPNQSL